MIIDNAKSNNHVHITCLQKQFTTRCRIANTIVRKHHILIVPKYEMQIASKWLIRDPQSSNLKPLAGCNLPTVFSVFLAPGARMKPHSRFPRPFKCKIAKYLLRLYCRCSKKIPSPLQSLEVRTRGKANPVWDTSDTFSHRYSIFRF